MPLLSAPQGLRRLVPLPATYEAVSTTASLPLPPFLSANCLPLTNACVQKDLLLGLGRIGRYVLVQHQQRGRCGRTRRCEKGRLHTVAACAELKEWNWCAAESLLLYVHRNRFKRVSQSHHLSVYVRIYPPPP